MCRGDLVCAWSAANAVTLGTVLLQVLHIGDGLSILRITEDDSWKSFKDQRMLLWMTRKGDRRAGKRSYLLQAV